MLSPPEKIIFLGEVTATAFATPIASIRAVRSIHFKAKASFFLAASQIVYPFMSFSSISLRIEGELSCFKRLNAVRLMPVAEEYVSKQPFLPHPHSLPSISTIVCPTSPANPSCPYIIFPFETIALPTPVPSVIIIKSFTPFAAP